jgi:uncharacterized membrane protein
MDSDSPIKLHFTYTYQDWVKAHRLHYPHTRRSFIEKIYALIMSVIGYVVIALHYHPIFGFMFDNLWDFFLTIFWFPAAVIMWFDLASIAGIWSRFHRKKQD